MDDAQPTPEGIAAQTRKVMDNLRRAPSGAGAGLEHVLCVRAFPMDFDRDHAGFNRVYPGWFPADRLPARSTVGVTAPARGGTVEIDMVAKR